MNTEINQKLSELLDGELHPSEEEKMLLKISKNPELYNKFNHFEALNHSLKSDGFDMVNEDFLDNIRRSVDTEPHYLIPKQKAKKRSLNSWQKTSVAIVACTVLSVILVSQKGELGKNKLQPNVASVAKQVATPHPEIMSVKAQPVETQAEVTNGSQEIQHERLKAYLQAHSDKLYTYDSLNFQPYARVVSQD